MRRTSVIVIVLLAVLAVSAGAWSFWPRAEKASSLRSAPIKRGDLVATINATGTLEPIAAIDIGAQVAGMIVAFGTDTRGKPVNWSSPVDKGTVLARIDDSLYAAAVGRAEGQLQQAEAAVVVSRANVLQQKANLLVATQNWERAKKLGPSDTLSQSAYDQYRETFNAAVANLASAEASVEQALASVDAARATLRTARLNLDYCTIRSPVKGIVIDRRVNIGQTVVATVTAPSLFLVANDVRRIQAWINVYEADVGNIAKGQPVKFTVDPFPGSVFQGVVGEVRLNATMTQNVVTYTVAVDVDNADGKLLPYLTVHAQFETGRRRGVLIVPNAALRFAPRPGDIAPDARQMAREGGGRRPGGNGKGEKRAAIWVEEGKFVRPVPVTVGLTDGSFTEVEGKGLAEGLRVAVGNGGAAQASQAGPGGGR